MFGNEEEIKNSLPNSMRIALITINNANPDLPLKIQERVLKDRNKNLEFIFVDNAKDLFKYKEAQKDENIKGLIDKNWINNFKNLIPSVIILYYELQIGINKENDEKIIYSILEEIKYYSKFAIIFAIIVSKDMKENPYNFNFNDRQKPFYLKNFLSKDKFYIVPDEQIWKQNDFGDLCKNIYNSSFQFYKIHHRNYKEKRSLATSREEKIQYDIKLGVLSKIKSKKNNSEPSKYLEEAYELVSDKNFDPKSYKNGSEPLNERNNFYEIRATGDWLFYKNNILYRNNISRTNTKDINKKAINISEINEQINKCEKHIKCFSNIKYYEKGRKDYFHFIEYYWLAQRYKNLKRYIEENNREIEANNYLLIKWFMTQFKFLYNIMKIIKFYNRYFNTNEFKLTEFKLNDNQIIDINSIEEEENIFYGKPPSYFYINKENENKKEIFGFNEEIFIKKFILKKHIKYDNIVNILKTQNIPRIADFITYFKNQFNNYKSNNLTGINMYLNILKNIGTNNPNIYEIEDIEFYPKIIKESNYVKKFPKVHISLMRQYINLIYKKIKEDNNIDKNMYKKELFTSLVTLGNLSKLTNEEENFFFELLNDENFCLDKQMIINLNYYSKYNKSIINIDDLSINFTFEVKDINKYQKRKILDIIEYEFYINSTLSKGNIKLNSFQIFFEYSKDDNTNKKNKFIETILKTLTKEELSKYELNVDKQIKIPYKVVIRYRGGKISLSKIMFSFCKKENIIYSINIPNEINKTIFISKKEADIITINYPNKTLLSGVNQLYKFKYSINKKQIDYIKIIEYKNLFSFQKGDKKLIKDESSGDKGNKEVNKLNEFLSQDESYIPPSIFYFNENKEIMEEIKNNNNFEYSYNNLESKFVNGKTDFNILFKFYKIGLYLIKLDIKYTVLHEEVETKLEFNFTKKFIIKVINPLSMTYNISSNNFSLNKHFVNNNDSTEEKKEFLTNTPIKMNLIFNNELDEDIIIKDIQMILKENNNCEFNTTIKEIIDSNEINQEIKEEILTISKLIKYTIPTFLKFKKSYNDLIGKCKILWTTKSLKEYENKINYKNKFYFMNETELDLPHIYVKQINIKCDYNYEIKDDNVIHLFIKIENKSKICKRLLIQIMNNDETSFIVSGITNYIVNLKHKEIRNIFLKLYVIQNGEIKLPDVIVKEVDYEGKERYRNNFYSEKIILN